MSIYDVGEGSYLPIALMNLGTSIGRGQSQGYAAGAGIALRNYQAQSLAGYHQGMVGSRFAIAGARQYAADRGYDGKMGAAELDARSKLADGFLAHAADLGQTFDPGTVSSIYEQAFSRPLADLSASGFAVPQPGSAPSPGPGLQPPPPAAPAAAPPGTGAPAGDLPGAAPPAAMPPAGAPQPAFAPSGAVVAKTGLAASQGRQADANAGLAHANALKTMADLQGPTAFFAAVSGQPQDQQRAFTEAWNRTHNTNYVMPGMKRPDGSVQSYYDQDVDLQAALRKTNAQIAQVGADTAKTNAQTTEIPLDGVSLRTYRDRMGVAQVQNSVTGAANAETNRYRAQNPGTDPFLTSQTSRLNELDARIAGANARKAAAFDAARKANRGVIAVDRRGNPTDLGLKQTLSAEDAAIQGWQAEQATIRSAISARPQAIPRGTGGGVLAPAPVGAGPGALGITDVHGKPVQWLTPDGAPPAGYHAAPAGPGPGASGLRPPRSVRSKGNPGRYATMTPAQRLHVLQQQAGY